MDSGKLRNANYVSTTQGSTKMDDKARELKERWKAAEKEAARSMFPLVNDKLEAMFDA